jgi:hypothetical protein
VDDQITALFGLHASMTLGPKTMERCAAAVERLDVGVHVHVGEAECDGEVTRNEFHENLMERFEQYGMTGPGSLFAHGIHLDDEGMAIIHQSNSMMVTNPESNMNNGLYVTPVLELLQKGVLLGLGTDGMSNALIAQARACLPGAARHAPRPAGGVRRGVRHAAEEQPRHLRRLFKEHRGVLIARQAGGRGGVRLHALHAPPRPTRSMGICCSGWPTPRSATPCAAARWWWRTAESRTSTKRPSAPLGHRTCQE